MKHAFTVILVLLLVSCADRRGERAPAAAPAGESLTRKAWAMRRDGLPVDSIIAVQKLAVAELRRGESPDNPVEVLEQMGYLYNIAGDFASALRFYEEATDSMKSHPLDERNDGAIQLFGDLSSLYAFVGEPRMALQYSDSAIAESLRQGGAMLSDVYRFRAGIYESESDVPGAMRCYALALEAVDRGPTRADKELLRALIMGERAHLLVSAYPHDIDSVNLAVSILEEVVGYDGSDTADRVYALGLGYVMQGRVDRGLPLLRRAAESYRAQGDIERVNVANTALLETYARQGMCAELAALVPRYIEDADSLGRHASDAALAGAMVRYDLRSARDRNRILALRLEVERDRRMLNLGIALAAVLALAAVSVILWQRMRLLDRRRLTSEREASRLGESNTLLNRRVDTLERDLSAGMNSNSSILSSPVLITGREEGRFRRAFSVLYPGFIPALKGDFPRLTPGDELLCMLLYLRHTTDEVAVYLGISRASVNSARYRLRTKFALPRDVDLDTFICSRQA